MLSRWLNIAGSVHLDASKNSLDYNILSKWIRLSSLFHIFLARILGDTNEEYSRFHVICAWVQFAWSQLCSHYSPPGYFGSFSLKSKTKRKRKTTNIDKILGPLPFVLSFMNAFQKHFVVFQNWLFQIYHNFFFDWWVDVSNYWKHLMSSENLSQKSIWIVWSSPRGLGISCELMRPPFLLNALEK